MRDYNEYPIRAMTAYSKAEVREFQHAHAKKQRVVLWVLLGVFAAAVCLLIVMSALMRRAVPLSLVGGLVLAIAVFVLLMLSLSGAFYSDKKHSESQRIFGNGQRYVFQNADFEVEIEQSEYAAKGKMAYSLLHKAVETSTMFYLYLNKSQAYLVSKAGIQDAAPEELAALLQAGIPPAKYKKA